MGPEILARFDDRPRLAVLPDGELLGFHVERGVPGSRVCIRRSGDGGYSWSAPEPALDLPLSVPLAQTAAPPRRPGAGEPAASARVGAADDSTDADPIGGWGGCEVLVDSDGEIHLFLVNDRATGVAAPRDQRAGLPPMGPHDRRLDVWHTRTDDQRSRWRAPQRIWRGYTGSLNSVTQLRSGRIVLPFAMLTHRTWPNRGEGLDAFWFAGTSTTIVLHSDDGGTCWQQSPAELKVPTPSIGTYGAVEPVVVQRGDGVVWMLMRTQLGRFYESFSADGDAWSPASPSRLVSSDSPAGLVRLPDDRLVLLSNECRRFPYAHGGRHVLHAAVSEDHGRTWLGRREVARDPMCYDPPPPGGDHGTAYPYPVVLPDGRVLATTGQGAGRILIAAVDPAWLYEQRREADLSAGLGDWSAFGCRGVDVQNHAAGATSPVLSVRRVDADWPAAAVWNFPSGLTGRLETQVCLEPGAGGAAIALTDHFSVPFDPEDLLYASFVLEVGLDGRLSCGGALDPGAWHELVLEWDCTTGECSVLLDGDPVGMLRLQHVGPGVNYVRVRSTAAGVESGGLLVAAVNVDVGS